MQSPLRPDCGSAALVACPPGRGRSGSAASTVSVCAMPLEMHGIAIAIGASMALGVHAVKSRRGSTRVHCTCHLSPAAAAVLQLSRKKRTLESATAACRGFSVNSHPARADSGARAAAVAAARAAHICNATTCTARQPEHARWQTRT